MSAGLQPPSLLITLALGTGVGVTIANAEQLPMSQSRMAATSPFPSDVHPLAQAVANGDTGDIASLSRRSPPNPSGQDNVTLLEWAIWNRQPASLAALLLAGFDPSTPGMEGESVAHLAASVDDPRYLQVLIAHGAPVDLIGGQAARTPIFRAVQSRRDAQFALLLAAGADINRSDAMGNTLLHVAAEVGDAARVLQLLQAGADYDNANVRGVRFQSLLLEQDSARLSAKGRADRQAVLDWLTANQ